MTTIEIDNVTKTYGPVTALDDVSLQVEAGTSLGLIGTNGAGKTTLFRLLVGHERPDAGRIRVGERNPRDGPGVRRQVGYLPEHAGFDPRLTGREVLRFHARLRGVDPARRDERVTRVLHTVGLDDAGDRRVSGYSNGMNRRLGLATLLVGDPQVLLLDEPTAGLDPVGVESFHDLVTQIREQTDITLLVTSHILSEIERLCEDVAVLRDGELLATGDIDQLERASDDTVTIDIGLSRRADETIAEFVDAHPTVSATRLGPQRLELVCPSAEAYETLGEVKAALPVETFEVRRPGLDGVFDQLVDERTRAEREVPADD